MQLIRNFFNSFVENKYVLKNSKNHYEVTLSNLYYYGFHKYCKIAFLIFFVILPILFNILGSLNIFTHNHQLNAQIIQVSDLILLIIGFLIIFYMQGGIIFRSGAGGYFLFKLILGPVLMIVSSIASLIIGSNPHVLIPSINPDSSITVLTLTMVIFQIFAEIVFIIFFFKWNFTAWELVKNTFKSFKKYKVIIYSIILILIMFGFTYLLNFLTVSFNSSHSESQSIIEVFMKTWWGTLVMIPFTLLVAPIAEEIAYREGIFSIFGKSVYFSKNTKISGPDKQKLYIYFTKLFAIAISSLIFANEHVLNNIENIYLYIGTSIAFSIIYLMARCNFVYSIILHIAWNILVFALIKG